MNKKPKTKEATAMVALMDDIMIAEDSLVHLNDALASEDTYHKEYLCRLPVGTVLVRVSDLVPVLKKLPAYDTMRLMRYAIKAWSGAEDPSQGSCQPASHYMKEDGDARFVLAVRSKGGFVVLA